MLLALLAAIVIIAASTLLGQATLRLLSVSRFSLLAPATGFAILLTAAPFLIRLPGRATTASTILLITLLAATYVLVRETPWWRKYIEEEDPEESTPPKRGRAASPSGRAADGVRNDPEPRRVGEGSPRSRTVGSEVAGDPSPARPSIQAWALPVAVVAITIAAASLPFLLNERFGVLGEGIYTNDHAAQLYWADWLQHGFGAAPDAVRFGYPVGPQALAAIAAQATAADLVEAFNGLLLAIPALTGLTALAVLGGLSPGRRVLAASLTALPYLAASFLAQSAFKETAMALLVLAFAVALRELGRGELPRRATLAVLALLAVASVLTYSLPGLAWFGIALAVWIVLELGGGRRPVALGAVRGAIVRHRALSAAIAVGALALVGVAVGPALAFLERVSDIQFSAGRLSSPVFPGEVLGVWPEGDFRLVRGEVAGAIPAALVGLAALAVGLWQLVRRAETALLATVAAAAAVYAGSRLVAEIHVEAKALAVMAPLVMAISLGALLAPVADGNGRALGLGRLAFGSLFAAAAIASTFLALRAAPVGFDDRAVGLERLGDRVDGSSVAFLGVDRFGAYRLRGTDVRSPGGFVPPKVNARSRKRWSQGQAMDVDTLAPRKLDRFEYAITTTAAFQSTPPPNLRPVITGGDYALWHRIEPTAQNTVLPRESRGVPGSILDCAQIDPERRFGRGSEATVIAEPVVGRQGAWEGAEPIDEGDAAAGQEGAFSAPATLSQTLELTPGAWLLSLQYHSQVPLTVEVDGELDELPPSLDGMYLDGAGRGSFWPAGRIEVAGGEGARPVTVTVRAAAPSGLQDLLGVERRLWLGNVAASRSADPRTVPVDDACSRYVDRILPRR